MNSICQGLIWTTLATIAGGCATRPLHDSQELANPVTQSDWANQTSTAPVNEDWIQTFGDPQLAKLVSEALDNNFNLAAASARTNAAKADAAIAAASRFPFLNLNLTSGRQKSRFIAFDIPGLDASTTSSHSLDLGAQWEVDLWGKVALRSGSAKALAEISEQELEGLKLSLAAQVSKAWFNATQSNQQLQLSLNSVKAFDSKLHALEKRYQRGLIAGFDLRLTRAQAATARADAQTRRIQKNDAVRILETLLGRYPQAKLATAPTLPKLGSTVPAGLPSQLLARRPDVNAEERRLASALAQQKIANRNWLPQLVLTGSAGTTSKELSNLLDPDFDVWSLFGSLTAPLFQAGKLKAERQKADALLEAQIAQYKNAVLTAFREVESALSSEPDLLALESEIRTAAVENKKAEDQAWELYTKGLIDITAVLDSERRATEAQSQLINVVNQRLQNRINLHLALGGSHS